MARSMYSPFPVRSPRTAARCKLPFAPPPRADAGAAGYIVSSGSTANTSINVASPLFARELLSMLKATPGEFHRAPVLPYCRVPSVAYLPQQKRYLEPRLCHAAPHNSTVYYMYTLPGARAGTAEAQCAITSRRVWRTCVCRGRPTGMTACDCCRTWGFSTLASPDLCTAAVPAACDIGCGEQVRDVHRY